MPSAPEYYGEEEGSGHKDLPRDPTGRELSQRFGPRMKEPGSDDRDRDPSGKRKK